jgi:RND family efflux transporter MFP subunit
VRLQPKRYPVVIRTQGTVQPTISNAVVPEVAGTVTALGPDFVVGGRFAQGDLLLEIDRRDYEIALTTASANLAQATAQLHEQEALADQARHDWRSLGRPGTPAPLTLREPQLAAARANTDAARAQLERAELDLQRTRVLAPYAGVVGARSVDAGQFVARGTPVGQVYAIKSVDIRLPLTSRQLTYLDTSGGANVELNATIGGQENRWTGTLVRVEGVDAATQQLYVIARVYAPYAKPDAVLRVGQFAQALIAGEVLQGVFVIPRAALREEREVLLVDADSQLYRQRVSVAWSDDQVAAIRDGLQAGDVLVTTPMSTVADGTPVRATIDGVPPAPLEPAAQSGRQSRSDTDSAPN